MSDSFEVELPEDMIILKEQVKRLEFHISNLRNEIDKLKERMEEERKRGRCC